MQYSNTQYSENTRKRSQSDPGRFCLCSDGSVRFRMSVVRLDRSSRWSQFAFLLGSSLESFTFCDFVHEVSLRCRFVGETSVFLVRYQYHFIHGRELTTFNRWTMKVVLLCRAFSLSRFFVDFLPKTLSTFFSLFLSDGYRMTLPLMTL
jgi:hypothetical protein